MPELPGSMKSASQLLLRRSSSLASLYTHSRELLDIQSIVRQSIPGDIYVASLTDGTLHLITPSSALATRLRYTQRKLVSSLRQVGIEKIRISVRPDFKPYHPPEKKSVKPPSPESASHIESTAQYIEYEPLRKALIRLSRHGRLK